MQPTLVFVAGPNGAGKTTTAPRLLKDEFRVQHYVNADLIASGLSFNPEEVAWKAGRVLLERVQELAASQENFALETTLSGRGYVKLVRDMQRKGYRFILLYLWLPSADQAVARVHLRVALGGHNIPVDVVRRRYLAGLKNFFELYAPLADAWSFYDNSMNQSKLLAYREFLAQEVVVDETVWRAILEICKRPT